MSKNQMWTKEDLKKIVSLWDNKTTGEIADELRKTPAAISYIAGQLRKAGVPIQKKNYTGYMNNLISETFNLPKMRSNKR